jgi:hypothetical protein
MEKLWDLRDAAFNIRLVSENFGTLVGDIILGDFLNLSD